MIGIPVVGFRAVFWDIWVFIVCDYTYSHSEYYIFLCISLTLKIMNGLLVHVLGMTVNEDEERSVS